MASSKTRVNVARVAAGAVFAAGASLAIAGVAQADVEGDQKQSGISGEICVDIVGGVGDECEEDSEGATEGDSGGETEGGTEGETEGGTEGETEGGTEGETEGGTEGETEGGTEGETEGGTEGETEGETEGDTDGDTRGTGGGPQGVDNGGTSSPQLSSGGNGGIEQEAPDEGITEVEGDEGQPELAETGASTDGLVLIGAATMIAGGVAFRYLPRLIQGGGGQTA